MESTIEQRVEDAIAQIDHFLRKVPVKNACPQVYVFPSISITDVRQTGSGMKYATIDVEIAKDDEIYTEYGQIKKFKNVQDYWDMAAKTHLKNPGLSYTYKAIVLSDLKKNIIEQYQGTDHETVKNLCGILDEAIQNINEIRGNEKEIDAYQVPLKSIKKLDPAIKGACSIRIQRLVSELFLNPQYAEKIAQHEKEGKLTAKTPAQIRLLLPIIYE